MRFSPLRPARATAAALALLLLSGPIALFPGSASAESAPAEPAAGASGGTGHAEAKKILDHVDDLFRGDSSRGKASMTVKTEHWERTLQMEFWSKGKEYSLIRILSPAKEKGTVTLKAGNDIWNYLPKVKRVIKLPSSMMSSSWMGSHFTNDDLVKESRMSEDYNFEISFQGPREGTEAIDITCIPREEAVVVWGKVVVSVRAADHIPLKVEYFDEDLKLARTMRYADEKKLGGRMLPATLVMVPQDKPGEFTKVVYEEIDFDLDLPQAMFSIRELQK